MLFLGPDEWRKREDQGKYLKKQTNISLFLGLNKWRKRELRQENREIQLFGDSRQVKKRESGT